MNALYIHPTKGYRGAARPRKTNRRRQPIRQFTLNRKDRHGRWLRIEVRR